MKQLLIAILLAGSLAACQSSANPLHGQDKQTCDKGCMVQHSTTDSTTNATNISPKSHACTDGCKSEGHADARGKKTPVCKDDCKN